MEDKVEGASVSLTKLQETLLCSVWRNSRHNSIRSSLFLYPPFKSCVLISFTGDGWKGVCRIPSIKSLFPNEFHAVSSGYLKSLSCFWLMCLSTFDKLDSLPSISYPCRQLSCPNIPLPIVWHSTLIFLCS